MNELTKRIIKIVLAFIIPFVFLLVCGCNVVPAFLIALIVDAFTAAGFLLYHRRMSRVKEVGYEEICDRSTEILFKLKQAGEIIDSVTIGPEFMEVEHHTKEKEEKEKSVVPFIAWGLDGKKTYLHASRAIKDFLGKRYSIMMAGEFIVISLKEEKE